MNVPLAVVGMDFREGPSSLRALLKSIDDGPDSPSRRLRTCGEATGVVRIESCSRIEWVISANNPGWAAELLRGGLLSKLGSHSAGRTMHAKISRGALHYLVRVALGLESVAEGEHAIGRQVMRAFDVAHAAGATERNLHLCWHVLGRTLQMRKDSGIFSSVGVQSLVLNELRAAPKTSQVLVLGQGDIGGAVLAALHREGFSRARTYGRADLPQLMIDAPAASALIVCTGAPRAHLRLPQPVAGSTPMVIDVGSPEQVLDAPGWQRIGLDELLARRSLSLDSHTMSSLQQLADEGAVALEACLDDSGQHRVLEVLELEKKRFFQDDVEGMVGSLPPKDARRITAHLRGFTHRLLSATRRAARDS